MICFDKRKLIFVMPTKTGTHTLFDLFQSWGGKQVSEDFHLRIEDASEYIPDINSYTAYGFFRNPLERFLSAVRYLKQGYSWKELNFSLQELYDAKYDFFVDQFDLYNQAIPRYLDPQVAWLQNVNALDFSKFDLEVLKIARMIGISKVSIPVLNSTVPRAEVPSAKVIDFVNSYYAEDFRFGKKLGLLD